MFLSPDRIDGFLRRHYRSMATLLLGLALGYFAIAAQTNYLGTVFIADTTTPANQLKVNADGSVNTTPSSGTTSPAPYQVTWIGNQTNLTLASSTALTPTATATIAQIVVENNATNNAKVRCLFDGTAPTSTTGLEFQPGGSTLVVASNANLANVKCIQEASAGAIDVQYGK